LGKNILEKLQKNALSGISDKGKAGRYDNNNYEYKKINKKLIQHKTEQVSMIRSLKGMV
jgi:hypothetical protein